MGSGTGDACHKRDKCSLDSAVNRALSSRFSMLNRYQQKEVNNCRG